MIHVTTLINAGADQFDWWLSASARKKFQIEIVQCLVMENALEINAKVSYPWLENVMYNVLWTYYHGRCSCWGLLRVYGQVYVDKSLELGYKSESKSRCFLLYRGYGIIDIILWLRVWCYIRSKNIHNYISTRFCPKHVHDITYAFLKWIRYIAAAAKLPSKSSFEQQSKNQYWNYINLTIWQDKTMYRFWTIYHQQL